MTTTPHDPRRLGRQLERVAVAIMRLLDGLPDAGATLTGEADELVGELTGSADALYCLGAQMRRTKNINPSGGSDRE